MQQSIQQIVPSVIDEPTTASRMVGSFVNSQNEASVYASGRQQVNTQFGEGYHVSIKQKESESLQNNPPLDPQFFQSYRSNVSEDQLIELMSKKQSQLKQLETFLLKQFEEITNSKQQYGKIKIGMRKIADNVKSVKKQFEECRGCVKQEISMMNEATKEDMRELAVRLIEEHREATEIYVQQVHELTQLNEQQQSAMSQQQGTITGLKRQLQLANVKISQQQDEIQQLRLQLNTVNPSLVQPSTLLLPPQNQATSSQQQLEVSFSANTKEQQLISAIFVCSKNHMSSESLHKGEKMLTQSNDMFVQDMQQLTRGFDIVNAGGAGHQQLHASQVSSLSHVSDNQHNSSFDQPTSPVAQSEQVHESSVQRMNTTVNVNTNDDVSMINRLDVFSNYGVDNSREEDEQSVVGGGKWEVVNRSNEGSEWRDMRRDKVTRSMKSAIVDNREESGMHVKFALANRQDQHHTHNVIPQTATHPSTSINDPAHNLTPHLHNQQSPQTRRKHRYDYCKLYQEQQLKEIDNLSHMCNHIVIKDLDDIARGSFGRQKGQRYGEVGKYKREVSPQTVYMGMETQSKSHSKSVHLHPSFTQQPPQHSYHKLPVSRRSDFAHSFIHPSISSSSSKKHLTIQIPTSPHHNMTESHQQLPNPYYKVEKHLHQLSYQEFSPDKEGRELLIKEMRNRASYKMANDGGRMESGVKKRVEERSNKIEQQLRMSDMSLDEQARGSNYTRQADSELQPNNIDRKEYIKSKIEHIKRKNVTTPALSNMSSHLPPQQKDRSPQRISFLKSQQQQNQLSRVELDRTLVTQKLGGRQKYGVNKREWQEERREVKGYNFVEDKLSKEVREKSRQQGKEERNAARNYPVTREFTTGDDNDIYSQLNSRHTTYVDDHHNHSKQNLPSYTKHSPSSKSPLQRATSPHYPSTSPLKSRHTNSLYLQTQMKSSQKKGVPSSSSVYHEEKYLERNGGKSLYRDERGDGRENVEVKDSGKRFGNGGVFRRF